MKWCFALIGILLLAGCNGLSLDYNSTLYRERTCGEIWTEEVIMCCSEGRTICWSEGAEISIGNETDMDRINKYSCQPENQTWVYMCVPSGIISIENLEVENK